MAIGQQNSGEVLHSYTMEHLGAPFTVVLVDSVRAVLDSDSGEKDIVIPHQQSLMKLIASTRASDARKLSGADIRFLRKTLGMKSYDLAQKLDVTAEHLSRCESGAKTLSNNSEKLLRLLVLLEPFHIMEEAIENATDTLKRTVSQVMSRMIEVTQIVHYMKINPIRSPDEEIVYEFALAQRSIITFSGEPAVAANDDDYEWLKRANA